MDDSLAPEDASLVAQLLMGDIAELSRQKEGYKRSASERVAIELYRSELRGVLQSAQDDKLARSLARAGRTDSALLDKFAHEEQCARRDRDIAVRLYKVEQWRGREYDVKDIEPHVPKPPEVRLDQPEPFVSSPPSSPQAVYQPSQRPQLKSPKVECIICTDSCPRQATVRVSCKEKHSYCFRCLTALFIAATKDESLFPPSCDGTVIPLDLARPHLTSQELKLYKRKSLEFTCPNRLYCSNARCSAFLGPSQPLKSAIRCGECKSWTCVACKAPWHGQFGLCGASPDDEAAAALQRDFAYKRCPSCHRVVELESGCDHITCQCRYEFCFNCLAKWKTCACPVWDERRLIHEERRIAERQPVGGAAAPPAAAALPPPPPVVPRPLLNAAECDHAEAEIMQQPGEQCQLCRNHLRDFILERNRMGGR
ncbi:hypothetical protein Rhopal_000157-T1 [Rhodotorula paludigena]|uniref:RBR-type E3 ubiquitin transferase n=1 Tax=Rhodotorula paludigena TaxID=86838 RepID=A0AAV5GD18_9BASI|nr:hypothetical protein Rhopal_000157-T1 [Rhodotorula paludigena]